MKFLKQPDGKRTDPNGWEVNIEVKTGVASAIFDNLGGDLVFEDNTEDIAGETTDADEVTVGNDTRRDQVYDAALAASDILVEK